ncbi:DUF2291 domain-containing protein [Runella sp.]|uniref:DUF2291 domain-containing protein n=1 Tax=Runella sp. TaxID=1960881 RepID=UPI003D12484C
MKKLILIPIMLLLGYNSVYFRKLSDIRKQKGGNFDFVAFVGSLYYKGILKSDKAIDLSQLLDLVRSSPDSAFKRYGNRLGIGNSAFFMVKSSGKISRIEDGMITLMDEKTGAISIDTKYVFGNAIRDASGLVKLTDFKTNADFNKVSEALNTVIREKALPPLVQKLHVGEEISFIGALKLSKKEIVEVLILPVQLEHR